MWVVDVILHFYVYFTHLSPLSRVTKTPLCQVAPGFRLGKHVNSSDAKRKPRETRLLFFLGSILSVAAKAACVKKTLIFPQYTVYNSVKKKIVLNKGELEKENFEKSIQRIQILTNGPSRCDLPLYLLYLSNVIIKENNHTRTKDIYFHVTHSWCLLYDLLMSPLDAAVSLKQINRITVHVPKHLNLHVSKTDRQRNKNI